MEKSRALLIYSPEDIDKNRWFIDHLTDLFAERGVELLLGIPEECRGIRDVSFVINRSRDPEISEYFEKSGIRSFNNAKTVHIGNDKLAEHEFFQGLGLPVMETVPGTTPADRIPFSFPVIVKERSGHGGSGVFKADSAEELRRILEGKDSADYIIQKMCDDPGKDMRVYILGGKIVFSVLRSSDADFRSNFSLGGKAYPAEPDEEVKGYVKAVCDRLSPDYIGFDLIRHRGGWVVNEIEDAAGARMLYALTDLDIALMYVCYICEKTSQNSENGIK